MFVASLVSVTATPGMTPLASRTAPRTPPVNCCAPTDAAPAITRSQHVTTRAKPVCHNHPPVDSQPRYRYGRAKRRRQVECHVRPGMKSDGVKPRPILGGTVNCVQLTEMSSVHAIRGGRASSPNRWSPRRHVCSLVADAATARRSRARRELFQQRARRAPSVRVRRRQRGLLDRRASSIPASCMAYWGEAMTYHQTLWRNENVDAARQALARLGPTPAARAREDADGAKEQAMARRGRAPLRRGRRRRAPAAVRRGDGASSTRETPDDPDVASFYALALLGTMSRSLIGYADAHEGHSQALAGSDTQAQVAEILERVLRSHPEHPGALHYLLHNQDDPAHAQRALAAGAHARAARARVEPHPAHAGAHLPPARALAGRGAVRIARRSRRPKRGSRASASTPAMRNYHALAWLQYRAAAARALPRGAGDHRRARAGRQGERAADAPERPVVDARALRDRNRRAGR